MIVQPSLKSESQVSQLLGWTREKISEPMVLLVSIIAMLDP